MEHGTAEYLTIAFGKQHEVLAIGGVRLDNAPQPLARNQRRRLDVDLALQSAECNQPRVVRVADLADPHTHRHIVKPRQGVRGCS